MNFVTKSFFQFIFNKISFNAAFSFYLFSDMISDLVHSIEKGLKE